MIEKVLLLLTSVLMTISYSQNKLATNSVQLPLNKSIDSTKDSTKVDSTKVDSTKVDSTKVDSTKVPFEEENNIPVIDSVITRAIYINSAPQGSIIFMDKQRVGKTPFTVTGLLAGSYNVVILHANYEKFDTTVTIGSKEADTLDITLISTEPIPDTVKSQEIIQDTLHTTTKNVSSSDTTSSKKVQSDEPKEFSKKKVAIIGSAILTVFVSGIVISEISGRD